MCNKEIQTKCLPEKQDLACPSCWDVNILYFFCSTFYMLSCYIIFNYYNLFIRQSNLRSQMWQNAWCCQFKSLENVWVAGAEEHSWSCSFDCMVSSVPSSGECVAAVHLNQSIGRAGWMAGISCRFRCQQPPLFGALSATASVPWSSHYLREWTKTGLGDSECRGQGCAGLCVILVLQFCF